MAKRRSRDERTREIIQVARDMFRRTGLEDTTLDMVAEAAGLPRPHLYRFFNNKAEIVSAVITDEVVAINDQRWAKVRRLRSFERQVVRSLELAVELVECDDFWSTLIAPGNIRHTAYAASADPKIKQINEDYWKKILERASGKKELRDDLEIGRVLNWLLGLQFMFMERREIFPKIEDVGSYAQEFVVPALCRNL